jgi:iron complex transport system ATP-binding protein
MTVSTVSSKRALLAAKDLTGGFARAAVFEAVSLVVARAEVTAIAGPNGAGKSTLLKTMARHLKPLGGQVVIDDIDIWTLPTRDFASAVGYVSQEIDSSQDLTVEELVMLGRNPHQPWWQWYGTQQDRQAVDAALLATEVEHLRHKPMCQLSGGERQRAAIAVALAQQPAFILLDEPTSHLDFRHQLELIQLLKRLREQNIGILVVLHDLNVIARIADKVLLIQKDDKGSGRVAAFGKPDEIFRRETLASIFDVEVSIITEPNTNQTIYYPYKAHKATNP